MRPSALASKTETKKIEKREHKITLEVLNEVSVEFPETKQFIEEHLEQECLKKYISKRGSLFSFYKPRNKELA